MNASEIISGSILSQMSINDDDKSFDGSKTFGDYKAAIAQTVGKFEAMLPRMKAAGTDMKKAAGEVDGIFRNMLRKAYGKETSFYTTRNGNKAIVEVTDRNIDDIIEQVSHFVANY